MSGSLSDPVEEITLRLAGLEITLSVRRTGGEGPSSSTAHGFEIVESSASGTGSYTGEPIEVIEISPVSREFEERVLRASSAGELEQLPLPFLDHLLPRLRAAHTIWTPKARLARAFRCGIAARRRADGIYCEASALGIPFRNCFYICLKVPSGEPAFWTNDYQLYLSKVRGPAGLHPDSVSQAFASHCEVQAFLVGAQKQWPRRL